MANKTESSVCKGLDKLKLAMKTGEYKRLYLLHGEESYLREHYLSSLRSKVVGDGMEEFNYRRLTPENTTVDAIREAVEALPMMAERTMVQVDDFDPFEQNEDTRNELITLFSDLPETCVLVFHFDTVPYHRTAKMKDLCAVIDKVGCEVKFVRQTGRELTDWIGLHFRQMGKSISPDLCQYLAFCTGGDMTALNGEIGKIVAYSKADRIVKDDIDAVTETVLSAKTFDITDALSAGNYAVALGKLRDILQMREEPIPVLATIGSHFRRILTAKAVLSANGTVEDLLEIVGSDSAFYAKKLLSVARRMSDAACRQAVELCYRADQDLKRSLGDGDEILELLLLRLSQEVGR